MKFRFSTQALLSAVLLGSLALAGCGGGSTPAAPLSPAAGKSITGVVIDGYIEGATVCLDLNVNQACESDEPSATTAKAGSYKLDTSKLTADQIKAAHLLTVVPTTAKDADDDGKTLAEAGKKGFSFLAPVAAYDLSSSAISGAVISPLTTLVSHDMIANGTVLNTAKTNVSARLGVSDQAKLTKDFVSSNDATLKAQAQMLTMALGEVKAQAKTGDTTDRQALFAALAYLQKQVADLQAAFAAAKLDDPNAKTLDLVKLALQDEKAKLAVAELVEEAKKVTESQPVSASSVVALLEQGLYGAENALKDCSNNQCTPNYWKMLGSAGKFTQDNDYVLSDGAWVKDSTIGDQNWALSSAGWKNENACAPNESATYSVGSDGVATVNLCNGITERVTARTVDASGKTLQSLGLNPPTAFASATMPQGSQLAWFTFANTEDKYSLHTGYTPSKWDPTTSQNVPFTSLESFVTAYTQPGTAASSSYINQWSGLFFSFAANNGLTLWNPDTVHTMSPQSVGTGTYSRRSVHGVEVLIIHARAPENGPGRLIMFSMKDGKVYGGYFRAHTEAAESDSFFNKTMINAIFTASGKPPVVD